MPQAMPVLCTSLKRKSPRNGPATTSPGANPSKYAFVIRSTASHTAATAANTAALRLRRDAGFGAPPPAASGSTGGLTPGRPARRSRSRRARRRSARRRAGGSGCRPARGSSSSAGTSRRSAGTTSTASSSPSLEGRPSATMNSSSNTDASKSLAARRAPSAARVTVTAASWLLLTAFSHAGVLERLRHRLAHAQHHAEVFGDPLALGRVGQRAARNRTSRASRPAARFDTSP